MQYIDGNILCLTYDEYVGFFGVETYKSDKKRGYITVHGLGGNGRNVLIVYESLLPKRKEVIVKQIGNPYDYMAKQPMLDLIDWDYKAQTYYTNYVLPNGSKLPATDTDARGKKQINYVHRYTQSVSWLNMLGKFTADKRELKRRLNISVMEFWDVATELIGSQKVDLPTNAKRLKEKLKEFSSYADPEDRYYFIMEKDLKRWGNANAKARDEEGEALILKMLADPNNHDDTVIAAAYNKYARENGKKEYTAGAIGYIRRQNEHILKATRDGAKAAYNKFSKEIGRKRPSAPLLLINGDDNNLDLYFTVEYRDKEGKIKKKHHFRPVLYVVIDAYNNYILGYAYGDEPTKELIYEAYLNAVNHIYELTGGYYMPYQLQSDRWGLDVKLKGDLAQFYNEVSGVFTPQAKGVPQGKYIESSFGVSWHQGLKVMPYGNYAGHNITAKERKSQEAIAENAKYHPSVSEMPRIIHEFITLMRMTFRKGKEMNRQQEWLQAFWKSEKSRKNQIDTATKLSILGKKKDERLTIGTKGIQGVFEGRKIRFDLPDEVIWKYNGVKAEVYYDPTNLSEVLITDGKGLRFVASEYSLRPSAIADYQPGDRKRLEKDWENKKQVSGRLTSVLQEKLKALDGTDIDPESLLQAGVLLKDVKNGAEALYLEQLYGQQKAIPVQTSEPVAVSAVSHGDDDQETDIFDLY